VEVLFAESGSGLPEVAFRQVLARSDRACEESAAERCVSNEPDAYSDESQNFTFRIARSTVSTRLTGTRMSNIVVYRS
jgi:hypothetical protein